MLTVARLREVLNYDPETGVFTWRVALSRSVKVGSCAGTRHAKGYWQIRIDGRCYLAHRLAWLYVHGVWPIDEIDHRYRVRDDNRIRELREATHAQNHQNRSAQPTCRDRRARIQTDGEQIYLGTFATSEAAQVAYFAAKAKLHPFAVLENLFMNNAGDKTHKPQAVDPVTFRAAATGIGQCFDQSVRTGLNRAQNVINEARALQRTAAQGYPQPTLDEEGNWMPVDTLGVPISAPVALKRAGK